MPAAATKRRPYSRRPRQTFSGVTLPRSDGRTIAARRYKSLVENFTHELGGSLSAADAALVRQAAALTLRAEQAQADIVNGVQVDADALVRVSSEARRLLGMLRTKGAKNKPSGAAALQEYIARKAAEKAANALDGGPSTPWSNRSSVRCLSACGRSGRISV